MIREVQSLFRNLKNLNKKTSNAFLGARLIVMRQHNLLIPFRNKIKAWREYVSKENQKGAL